MSDAQSRILPIAKATSTSYSVKTSTTATTHVPNTHNLIRQGPKTLHNKTTQKTPRPQTTTMAAATFHRFPDLPTELQMQIWSYAATPVQSTIDDDGRPCLGPFTIDIHDLNFLQAADRICTSIRACGAAYISRVYGSSEANLTKFQKVVEARKSLQRTCALARLVALEAWKGDLERMQPWMKDLKGMEWRYTGGKLWGCVMVLEKPRERSLQFVSELIE